MSDRNFPDKAIDALDEAGSRVHISNITIPKAIENMEQQLEEVEQLKNDAVKAQKYSIFMNYVDKLENMLILMYK